jgi:hypothetical protein
MAGSLRCRSTLVRSGKSTHRADLGRNSLNIRIGIQFHDGRLPAVGFTGAMLGLWAQDLDGAGVPPWLMSL